METYLVTIETNSGSIPMRTFENYSLALNSAKNTGVYGNRTSRRLFNHGAAKSASIITMIDGSPKKVVSVKNF